MKAADKLVVDPPLPPVGVAAKRRGVSDVAGSVTGALYRPFKGSIGYIERHILI